MGKSQFNRINNILLILCGIFSTAPIIAINYEDVSISLFTIFFFTVIVFNVGMTVGYKQIKLSANNRIIRILFCWLSLSLLSCLFGLVYYTDNKVWFQNSVIYLGKTLVYIIFLVVILNRHCEVKYALKGILYGIIANLIWVIMDATIYYIAHISLTNKIFASYIVNNDVRHASIDTFEGGLIRPAGFNTDPASVGLFSPILLLYGLQNKNYLLIILSVISIVCSGSTTAFACSAMVVVVFFIMKRKKNILGKKKTFKQLGIRCVLITTGLMLIIEMAPMITSRVKQVSDRVNQVYVSGQIENLRVSYIKEFPQAVFNQNVKIITGTGFNTSSEGYLNDNINSYIMRTRERIPFDIENLYIAYFFDNGLLGFIVYLLLLIKLTRKVKGMAESHYGKMAFAAMLGIIFSSMFYHYTLYSVHILTFAAICKMDRENCY